MQISVIGAGYVGLTTAACLAEIGHHVFCAENDPSKLDTLRADELPIFEPYLAGLVTANRSKCRIQFGRTEEAVEHSEAIFICVGTPLGENGEVDVSAIEDVAHTIARTAKGYRLVIQKSTAPAGGCQQLQNWLEQTRRSVGNSAFDWDVVANPEFLREGSAVHDFLHPDRIVIGADSGSAIDQTQEIFRPIIERRFTCPIHDSHADSPKVPIVIADPRSAELIKHASNSFLAMKVSFVNMMADLCEAIGGDIEKVVEGMGLDHRIGPAFLRPGIGFGGSCFPKDVQGFIQVAEQNGCDFSLLKEVERINQLRVEKFVAKVKDELGDLRGKRIGVWGLAFKPNTDDIRNSPAIAIVRRLIEEGALVQAYDPQAMGKAKAEQLPEVHYCQDAYEAAAGTEAVLVLTEWPEFREMNFDRLRKLMRNPLIFEGRNVFSGELIGTRGFSCFRIGQPSLSRLGETGEEGSASVNLSASPSKAHRTVLSSS